MGNILKQLIKRYGFGLVMGAITLDSYRRTVANDQNNNTLEKIRKERDAALQAADTKSKDDYQKQVKESSENTNFCATSGRYNEAADEHQAAVESHNKNPTEYRQNEVDRAKKKLNEAYEELKSLNESSIFEYFNSFYLNYTEYLDTLTADKIVCVFNIIMGVLTLSSFFTILSLMLSENIINKIKFLERFPRILELLRLRNYINKQIAKFYLFMHLFIIVIGILCNTIMLFY